LSRRNGQTRDYVRGEVFLQEHCGQNLENRGLQVVDRQQVAKQVFVFSGLDCGKRLRF
jgi:hypothetical protein